MKLLVAAVVLSVAAVPSTAGAQPVAVRGIAAVGSASDVNREQVFALGGGVVADLGQRFVSAGAQGDAFTSDGYWAGRGSVFGQFNLVRTPAIRLFALTGVGFGEYDGPMVGGGLDIWPDEGRFGFRLAFEDYLVKYDRYDSGLQPAGRTTGHQLSVKLGVLF